MQKEQPLALGGLVLAGTSVRGMNRASLERGPSLQEEAASLGHF